MFRLFSALLVVIATAVPSVAHAADEPCLSDLRFVVEGATAGSDPVITGGPTALTKILHVATGTCTDAQITVTRTSDHATRTAVLDQVESGPRYYGEYAWLDLPAGEWRVSEYLVNGSSASGGIAPPFRIRYGSVVTAGPIATVTAPDRSVVSGTVGRYAGGVGTIPDAGRRIELYGHLLRDTAAPYVLVASGYADAQGNYRISLPLSANTVIEAVAAENTTAARAEADPRAALVRIRFVLNSRPSRWPANTWVKVTGRTTPGKRFVWMNATTAAGNATGDISAKYSNADGTFALYFPPHAAGGYVLHATLGGPAYNPDNEGDGLTYSWPISLVRTTTLTGATLPTTATIVRPGTKMSAYGHLTITDGTTKPYAGQRVLLQTRPHNRTDLPYATVAAATTTGTGYWYTNWTARTDVDVRAAYQSTVAYTTSSYRFLGFVDVH
jgi:hypothetical protein